MYNAFQNTLVPNVTPANLLTYQQNLKAQLDQVNNMLATQPQSAPPQNQYYNQQPPQQQQISQPAPQQPMVQGMSIKDLEMMVANMVSKGIAAINSPTPLLQSIGSVLPEHDQVWLSTNLNYIPSFLKTSDGSEMVQMFMEAFKGYIGQTK